MSDISCLHHGDRLKAADVITEHLLLIVWSANVNVTLSHFEFELACLLDLRFFKAFSSHISEHIICIRQVFTKCRYVDVV